MKIIKLIFIIILILNSQLSAYFLLDDFEDGDEFNTLEGVWYTFSDNDELDKSSWIDYNRDGIKTGTLVIPSSKDALLPVIGGANGSLYGLMVYFDATVSEYITGVDQNPYGGIGTSFGEDSNHNPIQYNLSTFYAIGVQVKSTTLTNFRITFEDDKDPVYSEMYSKEVTIKNKGWNTVLIPLKDFSLFEVYKNGSYYASFPDNPGDYSTLTNVEGRQIFNKEKVVSLSFNFVGRKFKGYFYIDNVYLLTEEEYNQHVLPVDSDYNGIADENDIAKIINVKYTLPTSENIKIDISFNRENIKGKIDIYIVNTSGGLIKSVTKDINESTSLISLSISKRSDTGKKLGKGIYILKVKFEDNFGNRSIKKIGLAIN